VLGTSRRSDAAEHDQRRAGLAVGISHHGEVGSVLRFRAAAPTCGGRLRVATGLERAQLDVSQALGAKPTLIQLCPATCDPLLKTPGSKLDVLIGCKTDVRVN